MSNSSTWPIDRTLSGAITPGQSGPGSNANEGVFCIPQSSSTTGASPSDCLVSYLGHSLGKSYLFAEMQLVYSTAPANWNGGFYVGDGGTEWFYDGVGVDRWFYIEGGEWLVLCVMWGNGLFYVRDGGVNGFIVVVGRVNGSILEWRERVVLYWCGGSAWFYDSGWESEEVYIEEMNSSMFGWRNKWLSWRFWFGNSSKEPSHPQEAECY